jgi:hypothetical protein
MNNAANTVYEKLVPHQFSTAKGRCPQGAELSKEHGSNTVLEENVFASRKSMVSLPDRSINSSF